VRSRLPEELWATAAKLARRDGITATARALGVDRPSLQKWTDRLEPRASTKPPKSPRRHRLDGSALAFVELLAASDTLKWSPNGFSQRQNPTTFLASDGNSRKYFAQTLCARVSTND